MDDQDATNRGVRSSYADGGSRNGDGRHDRLPSERVIDAVATETGVDPMVLDPLGEAVDVEALDALFAPRFDGTPRASGSVTLEYDDLLVTARSDGTVVIDKPPGD